MKPATFLFAVAVLCAQLYQNSARNHGRIIGGEVANAGQFPFVASIHKRTTDGNYFCAGTLIGNQWILTAAQCVVDAISLTIGLGSNNLNDANIVKLATDSYIVHPDFDPNTLDNDVAVIILREPISFTDYIRPISLLSDVEVVSGAGVSTVGWGQTSDEQAGITDDLYYVELVALSNEECKMTFGNQITDNMVCVDGNFNQGTCLGDIGGPLFHKGILLTYHVGISSFVSSRGCESTDPSGFTRTAPYVPWIVNVTTGEQSYV